MSDRSVDTVIPADMWQILMRIEATGVRSEAKVDNVAADVARIAQKQDNHETRIQAIESSLAVMVLKVTKLDEHDTSIETLKTWQTKSTAAVGAMSGVGKLVWTVAGSSITGAFVWLITTYMAS